MEYSKPPLPFFGNKFKWKPMIEKIAKHVRSGTTVLDLFGGSGFVSHVVKTCRPDLRVVWNDYDDYAHRLSLINSTNGILRKLRAILRECPYNRPVPIPRDLVVKNFLASLSEDSDWITIGKSLARLRYCRTKEEALKTPLWNNVVKTDYVRNGYLRGVERVRGDWKEVLKECSTERLLLFLDPPYPGTAAYGYDSGMGVDANVRLLEFCKIYNKVFFCSKTSTLVRGNLRGKLVNEYWTAPPRLVSMERRGGRWTEIMILDI